MYVKLCYKGKEMNISFQKKKKKKSQLKWAILGIFSTHSPLVSNSVVDSPGQALQRTEEGRILAPRPSCATNMLCDLE